MQGSREFNQDKSVPSRDSKLAKEKLGNRDEAAALDKSLANPLLKLESVVPFKLACLGVLVEDPKLEVLQNNHYLNKMGKLNNMAHLWTYKLTE